MEVRMQERPLERGVRRLRRRIRHARVQGAGCRVEGTVEAALAGADRKSTRLNSSHVAISYAVFCLKKKTGFSTELACAREGSIHWRNKGAPSLIDDAEVS